MSDERSTVTHSVLVSWMYGFTSGLESFRSAKLLTCKLSQISFAFSFSLGNVAVIPSNRTFDPLSCFAIST